MRGLALSELRGRDEVWQHVPLETDSPEGLSKALQAVTRTQRVTIEVARGLGFWSDDQPDENPTPSDDGTVEAIRRRGEGYVAAVQWHPEFHDPADPATIDDTPMLMDFLDAARAAKASR